MQILKLYTSFKPNKKQFRARKVCETTLFILLLKLSDTYRRRHPIGWLQVCES